MAKPIMRKLHSLNSCRSTLYGQRAFTITELVAIMVIIGILAVFAAPRFFGASAFQSRGFADQVQASLSYAQKIAIAQRKFVCVTFSANSLTLNTGATSACGTPLPSPSGGANYLVTAPSGITFIALPTNFSFDALGRPSASQTIIITGATNPIVVEAETGHVHTP